MLIITDIENTALFGFIDTVKSNYLSINKRKITLTRIFDTDSGMLYGTGDKASPKKDAISKFISCIPESIINSYNVVNSTFKTASTSSSALRQESIKVIQHEFKEMFAAIYTIIKSHREYTLNEAFSLAISFFFGCNLTLLDNVYFTLSSTTNETNTEEGGVEMTGADSIGSTVEESLAVSDVTTTHTLDPEGLDSLGNGEEVGEPNLEDRYSVYSFLSTFVMDKLTKYKDEIDKQEREAKARREAVAEIKALKQRTTFSVLLLSVETIIEQNEIAARISRSVVEFRVANPDSFNSKKVDECLEAISDNLNQLVRAYGVGEKIPTGIEEMIHAQKIQSYTSLERILQISKIANKRLTILDTIRSEATTSAYESLSKISEAHIKDIQKRLDKQDKVKVCCNRRRFKSV